MGADIYLESVSNKARAEWEPKFKAAVAKRDQYPKNSEMAKRLQADVEATYAGMYGAGYFRDNYNGYGLFAQTRLSWWQDVSPMLDEQGYLPVSKARELRGTIAKLRLNFASARQVAAEQGDPKPKRETYELWRKQLLDILDRSIELGEPLRCNL